jgi:uncharacterized protein YbaR (Trm112 family)
MDNKEIVACPKCSQRLSVTSGLGTLVVTCSNCRTRWKWPLCDESVQAGTSLGREGAPGTPKAPLAESIQQGSQKDSETAPVTADEVAFSCTSCQHPICIPNLQHTLILLTICEIDVRELTSYGIPNQGHSLVCPRCTADFMVLSAHQLRMYFQQIGEWHEILNSISIAEARGITPVYILPIPPREVLSTPTKLSDLTPAGRLLLLPSVTASAVVALLIALCFFKVSPKDGYGLDLAIGLAALALIPVILVGVTVFFAGKWLFEKKLNIVVVKKETVDGHTERLRREHYAGVFGAVMFCLFCDLLGRVLDFLCPVIWNRYLRGHDGKAQ